MSAEKPAGANRKPGRNHQKPQPAAGREEVHEFKPGLAARMAAVKLLAAVVDKKTSLDGMLDAKGGNPAYRALNDADRALVRAILNTALRHLPRIEKTIASLLDTPLPNGARSLHHIMVIAATQMLYLDVPDHSAVDLAVEQAHRDPRSRRFVKLVNAILRRLGREKTAILEAIDTVPVIPGWLFTRISKAWGEETARRIDRAQLIAPSIDLSVVSDPAGWAEKFGGTVLATGSVRLPPSSGAIPSLEGFSEGQWWVQDAAASIPARLFGDISGKRVADLCAAPGGKTAQLILAGADVTALDQSASRLARLKENLDRLGLNARMVETSMLDYAPDELFDAVLLDAPCSSTGTIRRHPDVPWTKGPDDIRRLAELQERMLRHALTLVRPGGLVVFSNCSLDPLEGETMIGKVIADGSVHRIPVEKAAWPGLEDAIDAEGNLRTTTEMLGGIDGFFACVLQKDK